jgi:hypothetical protein
LHAKEGYESRTNGKELRNIAFGQGKHHELLQTQYHSGREDVSGHTISQTAGPITWLTAAQMFIYEL